MQTTIINIKFHKKSEFLLIRMTDDFLLFIAKMPCLYISMRLKASFWQLILIV